MIAYMGNSLEDITIKRKPFIQKIKDRMMSCGADVALMTGSGPTVYALCRSEKKPTVWSIVCVVFVRKFTKFVFYRGKSQVIDSFFSF